VSHGNAVTVTGQNHNFYCNGNFLLKREKLKQMRQDIIIYFNLMERLNGLME
jgi:hypothetical protein